MNDSTPSTQIMMEESSYPAVTRQHTKSVVSSLHGTQDAVGDGDVGEAHLDLQGLTGRKKEYALLKASYKRIQKGKHPSEVVLISGLSGAGKSMLAESIREPVTLKRHGFFVSGKFDQLSNEPYSALVEALTDLCDLISQDSNTCRKIAKKLKGDISALSKVIPNLSRVTGVEHSCDGSTSSASLASFTQLKLACRNFLMAVASREHPVVLLIDDIQWADKVSIEIIQSIMADVKSKYLLLIGTYRSDEVHALRNLLKTVENKDNEPCLRCTSIHLDNFDCDQVASLIAKCTDNKVSETRELAELVIKRTDGNPLFVIRFIEMLQQDGLLTYNVSVGQWQWCLEKIKQETIACDNVVEIVKSRIQSLTRNDQSVLRLAAVLGFTFDKEVLKAATWKHTSTSSETMSRISVQVDNALKISEDRGLIEGNPDGTFRFCHDSISACLYSMTPRGKKLASVHLLLAQVMQKMNDNDKPTYLFSIADQLNRAKMLIEADADRLDYAQCNLRAAKHALGQSAFDLASDYAQHGLRIVDEANKWDASNYATVLDLHCVTAEALYCCGNLKESNRHLQQVFQHAESPADIARARVIHVNALGAHARLGEAIDVAFCGAREIGVDLPKRPAMRHAIWRLIKTKAMLRGKSDEQLLALPSADYEGMDDAIHFVGSAAHYASLSMSIPHLIVAITALMQLSVQGKCQRSSSFCLYGILETAMGNIPEAVRMAKLTFRMHELQDDKRMIAADTCIIHTFLIHWRAPLYDALEPLQEAYVSAMDSGVVDVAFLAVSTWMQVATFCGYPLSRLESYTREYFRQMYDFEHKSQIYLSLPYWQFCLNMMGQSDHPVVLIGEAMNEKTYTADAANANVLLAPQTLNTVRIILGCHFDHSHLLQSLIAEYESFDRPAIGHFMQYVSKFYVGLSYITLYRSFEKRSNKRKARKIANELRKWTLDGCPNTKLLWAFMEAELATLDPKHHTDRVEALFQEAIQEASAVQNSCVEAMANERAARYYHTQRSNEESARAYTERAIELYTSYGAFAKVAFLERTSPLCSNASTKRTRPNEIITKYNSKATTEHTKVDGSG